MPKLELHNPNAPTRVSGWWRKDLAKVAADRNVRLPDVGGHLPFRGKIPRLSDGRKGGIPAGLLPVNAHVETQPILMVPAGVAARAQVLRREIRRKRVAAAAPLWLMGLGYGGLTYAQGPRLKVQTPSVVKGALRDNRRPINGVQYYDQEVSPSYVGDNLIRARQLTAPADKGTVYALETPDTQGAVDMNKALRMAASTAQVPAVTGASVPGFPNVLPLLAVGLAFFLVFKR